MTLVNIDRYKREKKVKDELYKVERIMLVFEKTKLALSYFKNYVYIQELIGIIETYNGLFNLHKSKMESLLKDTTTSDT